MAQASPAGSGELRDSLIASIRSRRQEFEAAGERAEEERTLPADTVAVLRELGAFWLKTPEELGGTVLQPLEFCDVIEELAYADVSTAWACMIGNGCAGMIGGWLPPEGVRRVFPPGQPLPVVAGQPQPRGTGRAADGGYRVSGRWSFASGILHAGWVMGAFRPDPGDRVLGFVVPRDDVEIIDNWRVAGLQGTGSPDFAVNDVFVPRSLTYDLTSGAVRGGDLFRQELRQFVSNEVPPLCVGMARRALDDMTELASHTARFAGGPTLSERSVFLKELGRAETKVRAARLVHRDAVQTAYEAALAEPGTPAERRSARGGTSTEPAERRSARGGTSTGPAERRSARGGTSTDAARIALATASVFAVETCAEVIADLFRYGGGRVLSLSSPMQRHLRNAFAARQHLAITEEHYEVAGRERIQSAKSRQG